MSKRLKVSLAVLLIVPLLWLANNQLTHQPAVMNEELHQVSNDTLCIKLVEKKLPGFTYIHLGDVRNTAQARAISVIPNSGDEVVRLSGKEPEYFRSFMAVDGEVDWNNLDLRGKRFYVGYITSDLDVLTYSEGMVPQ